MKRRLQVQNVVVNTIIDWYESHGRDFPWRCDDNPFHVLLAEMLLRRTTASAVMRVYPRLVEKADSPEMLMQIDLSELEAHIETLGLQSIRAKNLKNTAAKLVEEYNGDVENASSNLEDLPGVGRYIASAVRNFSLSIPQPLVDGNIVHFVNRVFGTDFKGAKDDDVWIFISELAGPDHDKRFYWGVIDFVSSICLHTHPKCVQCPLRDICCSFKNRRV